MEASKLNEKEYSEIQKKVSEAVTQVSASYERRIASYHNQIVALHTDLSLKDEALLTLQDEAQNAINQLNETIEELKKSLSHFQNLENDVEPTVEPDGVN